VRAERDQHVLVIGYGNELRSDDALGPKLARRIEQERWPGMAVVIVHQLTPELAEPISKAAAVIFLDAAADNPRDVVVREVHSEKQGELRTHVTDPGALLELARQLYGTTQPAWWILMRAHDLAFGESLSAKGEHVLQAGFEAFEQLRRAQGWG
jgi:hydrogenase maturation protease